ncbi:MAG TPA: helicase-associated domain-containing protein [Candidatus Limnocylindrales bacterium]|nr:helicase-associated domain-containing protein [Candidatus Limnocylindrales bacterium]
MSEFAELIRTLPDEALAALLKLRPDLLTPVPADTVTLAARAQSTVSVARALDGLDQFTLEILDGLRLGVDLSQVPHAGAAVDRLRARFLAYGDPDNLTLAPAIDEVTSPYPAGLGRPAAQLGAEIAELMGDPAKLRRAVMSASPQARAVLDRLAEGPPVGTMAALSEPVTWLVEHHLLAEVSEGAVELPRELGLLLRRDAGPLGTLHPEPLATAAAPVEQSVLDSAGAAQAMSAVRDTESLLEALATDPAPVLRGGGLGVLPLRRLAKTAAIPENDAALLLEVAHAAGLIGELETSTESTFTPAGGYDRWREAPIAQRWARLANAWLAMARQPSLAGGRDERDRPVTVLSAQLEWAGAPSIRRCVLSTLAARPGLAPPADDLIALVRWRSPRKMRGREGAYREAIREAAVLGLTGAGGITTFGKALLLALDGQVDDDPLGLRPGGELPPERTPAVVALDALLPAPVDHVLVQADLTVVVPGPAEPSLVTELELLAEHESGGAASVYRVTPVSVRRALDAGFPAHDLHALFKRRSRTPVPQALTFLIDDVARTHGGLRAGSAGAYVRGEDESLITTVLADRSLADLQLRRLAPTVLITPFTSGRLLASLREAGYAPVPEDANGATVLSRPRVRRAPSRPAVAPQRDHPITTARLRGVVEEMRRGDARMRVARQAPAEVRAAAGHPMSSLTAVQAHTQALSILQQAVRDKVKVWVGYVDAHGASASRLVRPVSIGAGYLRAEDDRTQMLHTFALHRITAAALSEQPD